MNGGGKYSIQEARLRDKNAMMDGPVGNDQVWQVVDDKQQPPQIDEATGFAAVDPNR